MSEAKTVDDEKRETLSEIIEAIEDCTVFPDDRAMKRLMTAFDFYLERSRQGWVR